MNDVRDDIGYGVHDMSDQDQVTRYRLKKTDAIKIRYVSGIACGSTYIVRRDIAEDMIRKGRAVEER